MAGMRILATAPSGIGCPPPVAATDTIERWPTNSVKVSITTLLANDSDADGDPVTFTAFSAASSQGGVITRAGDWLFYAPPAEFTGADTFTYTVSDGRGAPVSGLVNVAIKVDLLPSPNLTITDLGNGSYRIRFDGIADRTYRIEYTESLSPALWNLLGSATADGAGLFEYIDTPPGGTPTRFYRSVWP